jgi:uncharacterized protein (TIGR00251 family)
MLNTRETEEGVVFQVKVLPRSSRCEIAGVQDGALKLRIMSPPVEGRANEECVAFLCSSLGVKKHQGAIIKGHKARIKTVLMKGVTPKDIEALMNSKP